MPQVINGQSLNSTEGFDKITSTDKITAGYFTDGLGKIIHSQITSASLQQTQENYYYGIAKGNQTGSIQFHVAYGNVDGHGSDTDAGAIKSKTEAIYKEWANILLAPTEVTGGFLISQHGSSGQKTQGVKDDDIFVLVGQRALMKDRLNKKNWTVALSGSETGGTSYPGLSGPASGSGLLSLTDDSNNQASTATPAGPRYNIVAGTDGTVTTPATTQTFGWYYPDQGVLVFSAAELSSSIPGSSSKVDNLVTLNSLDQMGFGTTDNVDQNYGSALRFINTLQPNGAFLKFRSEEDQTSVSYFCRARAAHYNFSNNPTFVSGSQNELRQASMKGNPSAYITGVELYDTAGNMVATGKLSTPLKKNFSSEATIKVKLTF